MCCLLWLALTSRASSDVCCWATYIPDPSWLCVLLCLYRCMYLSRSAIAVMDAFGPTYLAERLNSAFIREGWQTCA